MTAKRDDVAATGPDEAPRERPGTRTFVTTVAGLEQSRMSRVGLDLDDVIDEERDDYRRGRQGAEAEGIDADGYAATEDDRAIWERSGGVYRLMAVVRPLPGGDPEVVRFDSPEADSRPWPTIEVELHVWELVKHFGAEKCRDAVLDRMTPNPALKPPAAPPLTLPQSIARDLGDDEALARLLFTGHYALILEAVERLGADAVGELRRLIAEGKPIRSRATRGRKG